MDIIKYENVVFNFDNNRKQFIFLILFLQLYFDDVDTALKAVRKNHAWGLLYIPTNYTSSMAVRFANASKTSDLHVDFSTVQAWIDLSGK